MSRNMMLRSRTAHMPGAVLALDQVGTRGLVVKASEVQ